MLSVNHFLEGARRRRGCRERASLHTATGIGRHGTHKQVSLKECFFFRTEATNIMKQNEVTPGPNPKRTHLGNRVQQNAIGVGRNGASGERRARYCAETPAKANLSRGICNKFVGSRGSSQAFYGEPFRSFPSGQKEKRDAVNRTSQVGKYSLAFSKPVNGGGRLRGSWNHRGTGRNRRDWRQP